MKIVHITHALLEHYSYQDSLLPEAQAELGHEVTIISTQEPAGFFDYNVEIPTQKKPYLFNGCKIVRLPLKHKVNYRFSRYKDLYNCLTKESPDLIFFHELPYLNYIDIVRYVKRFKCKLVVDYHCDYLNSGKSLFSRVFLHKIFYRFMISWANKYIDRYYAITPGTATFMEEMYKIPADKIKLLPLGGTVNKNALVSKNSIRAEIRNLLGIPQSDKLIVTAGKIDIQKNTHSLVSAVDSLRSPSIHLAIIGTIDNDYYKKFESVVENNPNIHILGWKSPEEINNYFFASDIACFPGSQSALWQQAICCGLPLLCRYWEREGTEYLDRGGNVQFLYCGDTEEISSHLKNLLIFDLKKLQHMREIASTNGADYFSYTNIAQSVIDDFKKEYA